MGKGGGGVVRSEWESKGWGEETTSISEMGGCLSKELMIEMKLLLILVVLSFCGYVGNGGAVGSYFGC